MEAQLNIIKNKIISNIIANPKELDLIVKLAELEIKLGNYDKALNILEVVYKVFNKIELLKIIYDIENTKNNFISLGSYKNKLLTVSMIVKNEEQYLPGALESIKDVADEIIITDTGSTDNTIDIAKRYDAKINLINWKDDYSYARNESLKNSTGKWILYLDADERLSVMGQSIIRKIITEATGNIGAFSCEVVSKIWDGKNQQSVFSGNYPRLFKNLGYPLIYFFGKVHEQISPSIIEWGYDIIDSDLKIMHEGYAITENELRAKVKRNLNILSQHVQEEPENGFTWYHLGNTLYQMKLFPQAEECLLNALKCKNLTNFLSSNTALALANISLTNNDISNVIIRCKESIAFDKNNNAAAMMLAKFDKKR